MKKYTSPEFEAVTLLTADVITLSVNNGTAPTGNSGLGGVDYSDLDFQ